MGARTEAPMSKHGVAPQSSAADLVTGGSADGDPFFYKDHAKPADVGKGCNVVGKFLLI